MQAQPPRHHPYDKHLREQVVHLYFVSGVSALDGSADVLAEILSSGSSRTTGCIVQSACPRVGRAFSAPTESMMRWLPSCWCLLCTCLPCTSLAMLARTSMAGATRTHTFRALLLCVGSSSSAPTRRGGVCV